MSKVIILLIIIGAGFVGWLYWTDMSDISSAPAVIPQGNIPTPTPSPTPEISRDDTSDAALEADLKVIEGDMNNLNSDSAEADAGLKDESTY